MATYTHEFNVDEAGATLANYNRLADQARALEASGDLEDALEVSKHIAHTLFDLIIITVPGDARDAFIASAELVLQNN